MLSIVMPVYNRLENVKLVLKALESQLNVGPSIEVIIVDDGSEDQLKEWIDEHYTNGPATGFWMGHDFVHLRYFDVGPNKGFRGGRARNIGAFNAKGERLIFIDSDVVPNQNLLSNYWAAHQVHPTAVIVGRYFYLPKVNW